MNDYKSIRAEIAINKWGSSFPTVPANKSQIKALMALTSNMTRSDRIALISEVIGRDIFSANDLTKAEATALLNQKEHWIE